MTDSMNNILIAISILSAFVVTIVGIKNFSKLNYPLRVILYLSLFAFLNDLASLILAKNGVSNLLLINIYELILGYSILSFYFFAEKNFFRHLKLLRIVFVAMYLVVWVTSDAGFQSLNGLGMSIEAIILIAISLLFFFQVYRKEETPFLESSGIFLVAIGVLFYFSGALFSFLLSADILSQSPEKFYHSWILHNVSNTIKNTFFTIALFKSSR